MCMFCAAIPITATAGVALDSKQRQKHRADGYPAPRLRPLPLLTAFAILLLMIGSVFFHLKFPRFG